MGLLEQRLDEYAAELKAVRAEAVKLRKALVYVAQSMHSTPQHMLAEGIMLIDGDRVWVYYEGLNIGAYADGEPYSYKY